MAASRMEADGHLFDVGQIDGPTLSQLHLAQRLGQIKITRDSWPIRGCGPDSGEQVTVFQLTNRRTHPTLGS